MQAHRRLLNKRGGSRNEPPARRATRTVWNELSGSISSLFASLVGPHAFEFVDPAIEEDDHDQDRLFAEHLYRTSDGQQVDLGDPRRVALVRKVRSYGYGGPIPLPTDPAVAESARDAIVAVASAVEAEIERRASMQVSADLVPEVTAAVSSLWIRRSIASLRALMTDANEATATPSDLFNAEGLVPPLGHDN